MRATARRYWGWLLFMAAVLLLPTYDSIALNAGSVDSLEPVPFLASVSAHARVSKALYADGASSTVQSLLRVIAAGARAARSATAAASSDHQDAAAASHADVVAEDQSTIVVRKGQSLRDIAKAYGVPLGTLLAVNGLAATDPIQPGDLLFLPPMGGTDLIAPWMPYEEEAGNPSSAAPSPAGGSAQPLVVVVGEGETLWNIAQEYGITVEELVEANDLPSADFISVGQRVVIPGRSGAAVRRTARPRITRASIAEGFIWPSRGVLRSRFGWRYTSHHDGIDIAAPYGTSIYAAKAGQVIFAGWYYGYGRAVIIDHGDGVTTLYGHASKLEVRTGQFVDAGDLIAKVGSTGRSTGPHLHFEIRVSGKALNPLKYL